MRRKLTGVGLAMVFALSGLMTTPSADAQGRPGGRPGGPPRANAAPASKDPAAAQPGTYALDPAHASIVVRVMHEGTSYSTFRFYSDAGTLTWNPHVEDAKVEVTVDAKSIATPAPGLVERLTGERFLDVARFPQARFVSTGIHRTGPTSGEITGALTLLGQTRPVTIQAQLVGIGLNAMGVSTIGFTGVARFKRSDFGMTAMLPAIGDEIELQVDAEFNRKG